MDILEIVKNPLFGNTEVTSKINELMEMQAYIESQKDALRVIFNGKIPEENRDCLDGMMEEVPTDEEMVKMCWSIIRKPFIASGKKNLQEGWGSVLDF